MQSVTVLFRNRGESGPSHRFIFKWANTVSSVLDAQQMMTRGNLLFLVEVERTFHPYALLLQGLKHTSAGYDVQIQVHGCIAPAFGSRLGDFRPLVPYVSYGESFRIHSI